jgi:flagellar hook-associated protein 2
VATTSSSAVGSTIDVNSIVSQLMTIESRPLTSLQSRLSKLNANLSEFGKVRSELGALQSAARALGGSTALNVYKASLSNTSVGSATAGSGAAVGNYSLSITSLASTQTLVSPRVTDATAVISGSADIVIDNDTAGKSFTIAANNLSLNGIRDAINSASDNIGVVASVINDGTGSRLSLRSKDPGSANAVTDIAVNGDNDYKFLRYTGGSYVPNDTKMGQSVAASNATAVIDGVTVTSTTNAFTSAIAGVTFVATGTTTSPVTLSVTRDDDALVARMQTFVNAYNTFMTNNAARYGKDGALKADASVLSMMNGFSGLLAQRGGPAGNAYGYLSEVGVSVDKAGRMSLDGAKFRAALSSDSTAVGKLLADETAGVFKRFDSLSTSYLNTDGSIDAREKGIGTSTKTLKDQIDRFNARLDVIEKRLREQFSNLNVLLGKLQQTGASISSSLG